MVYKKLKEMNPDYRWIHVEDEEFKVFGKVLSLDASSIIEKTIKEKPLPEKGSIYEASIASFEEGKEFELIKNTVFGHMDIQCGLCYGHNNIHNGFEYHQGSEVNIAVTSCVLALCQITQLPVNPSQITLVYIPKGTVVEIYSQTMHYCPIETTSQGFSTLVYLLKGTNFPLDSYQKGEILTKQNKWFVTHESNQAKVDAGNVIGLEGKMITVQIVE